MLIQYVIKNRVNLLSDPLIVMLSLVENEPTIFALIYGTAKNNCIGDRSALIRMH